MTKTTKTSAIIKHINNQILTADLKDTAMSARKRIAIHGDIQRRSVIRLKRNTKATLVIKPKDSLTAILKNVSSSIPLTVKETTVRT